MGLNSATTGSGRMSTTSSIIQGVIYASVVAGMLWLCVLAYGLEFTAQYQALAILGAMFSFLLLRRFDLLAPWRMGRRGSVGTQVLSAWVVEIGLLLVVAYVSKSSSSFSRVVFTAWTVITPVTLLIFNFTLRSASRWFAPHMLARRSAVIMFANDSAQVLANSLTESEQYQLLGYFDDRNEVRLGTAASITERLGTLASAKRYIMDNAVDVVFVMLSNQGLARSMELIDELGDTTASIYLVPDIALYELTNAIPSEVEGVQVLRVAETPMFGIDGLYKLVFDFVVSLVALLLLSPLLILIAIMVRLDSPGPILFRQKRYGLNGQEFEVYKFRTMRVSDPDDKVVQVSKGDVRVTRRGAFLRRTSLDELPQLWNIVRGDMSLVGPRPHPVLLNEQYRREVRHYMLRHKVKPGLTGWAQVNGLRGETAQLERMEQRVQYDLEYIRRWSPLFDIRIILRTLLLVWRDRNAY
ncbi:MAG: undecaprenyl-phosphate glucose phosphotransferase [Pseudomonadota bacterium]|nr:undecaprenyl-phosphate glucose phosphotransferase [Pseudomonadota bacterium]